MHRILFLALFAIGLPAATDLPDRSPILIELFTSEGCSDCPPADRLLEQLDSHAVVLSEHVDYWDHDGWKDPFSSARFTERQRFYAARFQVESVYTPQMVIDGEAQFVGSDARRAQAEIEKARKRPKASVRLSSTDSGVRVEVAGAPSGVGVFLAMAEESATSQVLRGENSGRRLHHVAVARSIRKIGKVEHGGTFDKTIDLPAEERGLRAVVWLQTGESGPVAGAAVLAK